MSIYCFFSGGNISNFLNPNPYDTDYDQGQRRDDINTIKKNAKASPRFTAAINFLRTLILLPYYLITLVLTTVIDIARLVSVAISIVFNSIAWPFNYKKIPIPEVTIEEDKLNDTNKVDRPENILFIYSSGGGGHIQAMEAIQQELNDKANKNGLNLSAGYQSAHKADLMLDWLGLFGKIAVDKWNAAQKNSNIEKQKEMAKMQPLADLLLGYIVSHELHTFLQQHPEVKEIVNTQAMCNQQICQTVLYINKKFNRDIKIYLVMTDLPTKRAIHFWNSIKNLTKLERSVIELQTIAPQLEELTNSDDISCSSTALPSKNEQPHMKFFEKHCGPALQVKILSEPPVRKEFKYGNYRSRTIIDQERTLRFKWRFDNEKIALKHDNTICDEPSKTATFNVNPNDTVISVMLGSQGGKAILDYTMGVINNFQGKNDGSKTAFFIYCGTDKEKSSQLFNDVTKVIDDQRRSGKIPEDLIIVPLGNQSATEIAEALVRADCAIMRTGGIASFEATIIAKHNHTCKFLLHSESKDISEEDLLSAMLDWERGNAEFLIGELKATVINPKLFPSYYRQLQCRKETTNLLSQEKTKLKLVSPSL